MVDMVRGRGRGGEGWVKAWWAWYGKGGGVEVVPVQWG